ncbi:MAG TPA: glycosyl transferase family 2, partial [Candidatus Methylomirabilis sp.]
ERMIAICRQGLTDLGELWEQVLPGPLLSSLREGAGAPPPHFRVPDPVWAEVVYRFALAHHRRVLPRDHLLRSLLPLYLGRTAAFVLEMWEAGPDEVEARIEALATTFEETKALLESDWR